MVRWNENATKATNAASINRLMVASGLKISFDISNENMAMWPH
jgi:hypothetical protein